MENFDTEKFLSDLLEGIKAKKKIKSINEKIYELEEENQKLQFDLKTLSDENEIFRNELITVSKDRSDLKAQLETLKNDFELREKNLRAEFEADISKILQSKSQELDAAYKKIAELKIQLNEQKF